MKIVKAALALSVLAGIAFGYHVYQNSKDPLAGGKPNILVLSFCSLRPQHLRAYNPEAEALPALDKFFSESLVFKNAINGLPWTNVTNYIVPSSLRGIGYSNAKHKSLRIPLVPIHKSMPANDVNAELSFTNPAVRNYELDYGDGLKALKKAVTGTKVRPFFYSVHIKYMHFPLIDSVNQKDQWKTEFSKESAAALEKYLSNPEKYPEKAALLLTLFADPDLVKQSPFVRKFTQGHDQVRIGQIYQILSDDSLLNAWKKSDGYSTDIKILHESYSLKLRNLDKQLAEILDLYGRDDLKKTTAIVVTGDHGEALMESGHFLHANGVLDDQIRFPMAVRAAGPSNPGVIEDQYGMHLQTKLLQLIAETNADAGVLGEFVRSQGESIYVRNCQGTVDGVRLGNKFKLVSDLSGYRLFDVAADPLHLTDVRSQFPDMFFQMKEMLLTAKQFPYNLLACDTSEKRGDPLHRKTGTP